MDGESDHNAWMSFRLSRALDDIGVNRRVVKKRRETFLLRETILTLYDRLYGNNCTHFHFGSQSEGSTTPGVNSDTDVLMCFHGTNIMSDWADWEAGRQNLLMVKEETIPPQHYWLQFIKPDSPEPYRYTGQKLINCVPHVDRRLFASNKIWINEAKQYYGDDLICCGPSNSFSEMFDFVPAYKCKVVPPEVYRWFHRPRRGHWPTPEMMQAASECSCFLIPDGHFESLNNNIEWRISPSQIERILVFNFTTVQLKCYVVLKMIKKHIMEHYLRHNSKLTSFHCKTVMFFTLERVSPAEWREDRLIECIGNCLQTLKMFLMRGHLPHYIIPESNLFEGKITRRYQQVLLEKIKEFLESNLTILHDLQIDGIGQRIQNPTTGMFEPRSTIFRTINTFLAYILIRQVSVFFLHFEKKLSDPATCRRLSTALYICEDDIITYRISRYKRQALALLKPHIYSLVASIVSSFYIKHKLQLTPEIVHLYERSLDTDVASSRLKLASMFYCRGDSHRAAYVLNDVERRYGDNVHALCQCGRGWFKPDDFIIDNTTDDWNYDTAIHKVALCVTFTDSEVFCVPPILLYEMNRAVNDDVQHRTTQQRFWMDLAAVDSRPFLFYLQYLTYKKLGLRIRQVQAHNNLKNCFINQDIPRRMHHHETAAILLGHCSEMEGNPLEALNLYIESVHNVPRNNAANWHIRRLTGHF